MTQLEQQMQAELIVTQTLCNYLADYLTLKGVPSTSDEGLDTLVPKVLLITSGGDIEHDDTLNKNGNPDFLHITQAEKALITSTAGRYYAETVSAPANAGTLTLKNATETVISTTLTNSNSFAIALPTAISDGKINESVFIFKIGATLPTITQPSGIVWRGSTPTLAINTNWTIVYEQVNTTGTTYEIWAVATKNA